MNPVLALDENAIVYLSGQLDAAKAEEIGKRIIGLNLEATDKIRMVINSPGGFTSAAFAITDLMAWSRLPVCTTGLGEICSGGLIILMAGAKGSRVITPNTSILSHRFSWWGGGSHGELIAKRREEDLLHRRLLRHYRTHTKLKRDKDIEAKLLRDTDTWLSPEEAVAYGIADKVLSKTEVEK